MQVHPTRIWAQILALTTLSGVRHLWAFVTIAAIATPAHADVVCRRQSIQGFEIEVEVARVLLGSNTTNISEAKIFITVSTNYLYAQTNYVNPGFDYPTKLAVTTFVPLEDIVYNLLFTSDDANQTAASQVAKLTKESIVFFVERERVLQSPFKALDFKPCMHLVWVTDRPKGVHAVQKPIDPEAEKSKEGNTPVKSTPVTGGSDTAPPLQGQLNAGASVWQIITACAFGISFVVTLLVLAIKFPKPTLFQYSVFRIVLALAASGVAAMIPGFLSLDMAPGTGIAIRAAGALAVFAIVYFFNPAKLAIENESPVTHPKGDEKNDTASKAAPGSFSVKEGQPYALPQRLLAVQRGFR